MLNYSNILGATIASSSSFIEFVLQSKILIIVIILQHHALCKICYIILSVVWLSSYHYFCVPTKKSDNRNRLLPSWSNLHLVLYASEHPHSGNQVTSGAVEESQKWAVLLLAHWILLAIAVSVEERIRMKRIMQCIFVMKLHGWYCEMDFDKAEMTYRHFVWIEICFISFLHRIVFLIYTHKCILKISGARRKRPPPLLDNILILDPK